jgi:peptidyl-prolyl cis-trans isomerase D
MFDAIRERRAAKVLTYIIFGLIIISFSFWGIESYVKNIGRADYVAKVGGYRITQQEFTNAYRNRLDQLRRMFGQQVDAAMLDNPQQRQAVLEDLINRNVLRDAAVKSGLTITDEQLRKSISAMEVFQEDGKFSEKRYEQLLKAQGYTGVGFEERMREDLLLDKAREGIVETAIAPKFQIEQTIRANEQQREVAHATFAPADFVKDVKIEDAAAKTHYDAHPEEFKVPEKVKLEYAMLSAEKYMAEMTASEGEIKQRYEDKLKQGQYGQPEERQASHILIAAKPDASEADKKTARAKADNVLKEVKASPDKFSDLAKKYSEDTGSAQQGGDLGFFGKGAMVKPFEEAAFAMKPGDIQGPVESDFGFHIIKLTGIKEAKTKALAEVSAEIVNEIKREKANKEFAKHAEHFSDVVFQQPDTLKPAADEFKITLQQSDFVSRDGQGGNPLLANKKLLDAVFSAEVRKDKRNTEAIEVSPNVLVSARVLDYKPGSKRAFEEAKAGIIEKLKQEEAAKLAVKKGEAALADLKAGKDVAALKWSAAELVSRQNPGALAGPVLGAAFKADTQKLPAIVGAGGPTGYTLAKITKVVEAPAPDDAKRKTTAQNIAQSMAQNELGALVASLRSRATIDVKQGALEQKAEAPQQ